MQFDADSTKNIYNNFNGGVSYEKKGKSIEDFSYSGGVEYYFQNDRYSNKENYFNIKGDVKKLLKEHPLTVPLSFTVTSFKREFESQPLIEHNLLVSLDCELRQANKLV